MNLRRKILCKEALEKEVQLGHTELILGKLTGKEDNLKKAIKKLKCAFAGYGHGEIMGHPKQMAANIIDFLENNSEMLW